MNSSNNTNWELDLQIEQCQQELTFVDLRTKPPGHEQEVIEVDESPAHAQEKTDDRRLSR
jgi:hypothetical protein